MCCFDGVLIYHLSVDLMMTWRCLGSYLKYTHDIDRDYEMAAVVGYCLFLAFLLVFLLVVCSSTRDAFPISAWMPIRTSLHTYSLPQHQVKSSHVKFTLSIMR
jgi:hypothetical protein